MNLKHIAKGYANLILSGTGVASEKVEQLSKDRLAICNKCDEVDTTGESCELKIHRKLKLSCCKLCGCYLEAKTRSLEAKCPLKESKW